MMDFPPALLVATDNLHTRILAHPEEKDKLPLKVEQLQTEAAWLFESNLLLFSDLSRMTAH